MQTFVLILIILAMLGALFALVRGIVIFLRTSREDLMGGAGPSVSGLRQNQMMRRRIAFQALAIVLVILFLTLARSH